MVGMTIQIGSGGLWSKDPSDERVIEFDWTDLPAGAEITDSTFTVTGISGDITTTPLTFDSDVVQAGNRSTAARLQGGALGSKWRVDNRILTNEVPVQTIERSLFVLVENQ